ncbi:hypothetical protein ES703_35266 [subsurface metagenome]
MAIIKQMLGMKQIDGFKGKLDFYYYMGLAIARKWPRSQGNSQTPASVAQQPMFTYATRLWAEMSPFVKTSYTNLANACGLRNFDWHMRGYISGIYRYPHE